MNEAEKILVIILSSALAVFLILGIIVLTYLIQLMKSAKRLASKAEEVSETIENSIRSMSVLRTISTVVAMFSNNSHSKRR